MVYFFSGRLHTVSIFAVIIIFSSCRVTRYVEGRNAIEQMCFQTNISEHYYTTEEAIPFHEAMQDTLLINRFSEKSIRVASVGGLVPLLRQYVYAQLQLAHADTVQQNIDYLALQQKLQQRISLISMDVQSIIAEIECEREQINGIINEMATKQNNHTQQLTLGALGVGSITSIAAITLSFFIVDPAISLITLSGSIASAGLSLLTYRYSVLTEVYHPYNVLADVWVQPETSNLFPPFVWHMLHSEGRSVDTPDATPIDILIQGWRENNYFAEADTPEEEEQVVALIFGEGGTYNIGMLSAREQMLTQLQAAIQLIQQDINIFNRELHMQ